MREDLYPREYLQQYQREALYQGQDLSQKDVTRLNQLQNESFIRGNHIQNHVLHHRDVHHMNVNHNQISVPIPNINLKQEIGQNINFGIAPETNHNLNLGLQLGSPYNPNVNIHPGMIISSVNISQNINQVALQNQNSLNDQISLINHNEKQSSILDSHTKHDMVQNVNSHEMQEVNQNNLDSSPKHNQQGEIVIKNDNKIGEQNDIIDNRHETIPLNDQNVSIHVNEDVNKNQAENVCDQVEVKSNFSVGEKLDLNYISSTAVNVEANENVISTKTVDPNLNFETEKDENVSMKNTVNANISTNQIEVPIIEKEEPNLQEIVSNDSETNKSPDNFKIEAVMNKEELAEENSDTMTVLLNPDDVAAAITNGNEMKDGCQEDQPQPEVKVRYRLRSRKRPPKKIEIEPVIVKREGKPRVLKPNQRLKRECSECDYSTNRVSNLRAHMKLVHKKVKYWTCEECDFTTQRYNSLRTHRKAEHHKVKRFTCPKCSYFSHKPSHVTAHFKAVHKRIRRHMCSRCDYRTSKSSNLITHMNAVHKKIKRYQCPECEYGSYGATLLKRHMDAVHRKLKPHPCPECPYSAALAAHLQRHIISVHMKLRPYKCPVCEHTFTRRAYLRKHYSSVHNGVLDMDFPVMSLNEAANPNNIMAPTEDDDASSESEDIEDERPIEEGLNGSPGKRRKIIKKPPKKPRKHLCPECNYSAGKLSALNVHINSVHKKIKPHQCPECVYCTSKSSNLSSHINSVHKKIKRYSCPECEYGAFGAAALKRHIDGVHRKLKPFPCRECEYSAPDASHLKRHISRVHVNQNHNKRPPQAPPVVQKRLNYDPKIFDPMHGINPRPPIVEQGMNLTNHNPAHMVSHHLPVAHTPPVISTTSNLTHSFSEIPGTVLFNNAPTAPPFPRIATHSSNIFNPSTATPPYPKIQPQVMPPNFTDNTGPPMPDPRFWQNFYYNNFYTYGNN